MIRSFVETCIHLAVIERNDGTIPEVIDHLNGEHMGKISDFMLGFVNQNIMFRSDLVQRKKKGFVAVENIGCVEGKLQEEQWKL